MKKTSDNLFKLIKSLSRSEKGYFVKFSCRHSKSGNQYLKLFKAIEKQAEYNEQALIREFANEPFIRQIHVAKNYLYKIILKSLNVYNTETSLNMKMAAIVENIRQLYNRALYTDCLKYIEAGKKKALELEMYDSLLEIIQFEKNINWKLPSKKYSGKTDSLIQMELYVADLFNNTVQYKAILDEITKALREGGAVRTKEEAKKFDSIINNPLMLSVKKALSYGSIVNYYQIWLLYYRAKGNDLKTYTSARKLTMHLESNEQLLNKYQREYIFAYIQLICASFNIKYLNEALWGIKKMRALKVSAEEDREQIFFATNLIEILIYIVKAEFEKGEDLVPGIDKTLGELQDTLNKGSEITLFINIFYIYFGLGKYEHALKWINRIFTMKIKMREDILSLAHILSLITHYELNNKDLLEYAVSNTHRYLMKRQKVFRFEYEILTFIKNISLTDDKDTILEYFEDLRRNLIKLADDKYGRTPLEYFDFLSWIDSKITGQAFLEIKWNKNKNLIKDWEKNEKRILSKKL